MNPKGILTKSTKEDGSYYWTIVSKSIGELGSTKVEEYNIHPSQWIPIDKQNQEVEYYIYFDPYLLETFARLTNIQYSWNPPIAEAREVVKKQLEKAKSIRIFPSPSEKLIKDIVELSEEQSKVEHSIYIEVEKCRASPYYLATKYLTINGKPFATRMTEIEFNEYFK